jgi:hypothetical protein
MAIGTKGGKCDVDNATLTMRSAHDSLRSCYAALPHCAHLRKSVGNLGAFRRGYQHRDDDCDKVLLSHVRACAAETVTAD